MKNEEYIKLEEKAARSSRLPLYIDLFMLIVNFCMLFMVFSQLNATRKAQEVTNLIALNQQVYPCPRISNIIDDLNSGQKLLAANGGKYSQNEIENFLGYFEMIGIIKNKGYLESDIIHDMFGYDIEDIFNNKELAAYINHDVTRNDWPYLKKIGNEVRRYDARCKK